MQVGIRELRKKLSFYLSQKEDVEVTSNGKIIATINHSEYKPQSFLELPEKEQKRIIIKAAKESNKAQQATVDEAKKLIALASPTTSGGTIVTPKDVKRGADALREISKLPQPPQMYGCGCKRVEGKVLCPKHHRL